MSLASNSDMLRDERRARLRGMAAELRRELERRADLHDRVVAECLVRCERWEREANEP